MRHSRSPSQPMSDPRNRVVTLDKPVEHLSSETPTGGSMAEICCTIIEKLEQLVWQIKGIHMVDLSLL